MLTDSERFAFCTHRAHVLNTTRHAYDACQVDEAIAKGHTLIVLGEGVVGLAWAWPVAVLESGPLHDEIATRWAQVAASFRALFPPIDDNPVSGFLAIFNDPDFPTFGTQFVFGDHNPASISVVGQADQFEPEAVAALFQRILTRSRPLIVTWGYDSDRYQPDAFGGGGFRIDADGTHWIETSHLNDNARFAPKLVLAMRDDEEGLLFWNNTDGFGSLETADVFTEEQAGQMDIPIAHDQPKWIALPRGLRN